MGTGILDCGLSHDSATNHELNCKNAVHAHPQQRPQQTMIFTNPSTNPTHICMEVRPVELSGIYGQVERLRIVPFMVSFPFGSTCPSGRQQCNPEQSYTLLCYRSHWASNAVTLLGLHEKYSLKEGGLLGMNISWQWDWKLCCIALIFSHPPTTISRNFPTQY